MHVDQSPVSLHLHRAVEAENQTLLPHAADIVCAAAAQQLYRT